MGRAGERFDDGFELRPEPDELQGRIEQVGDWAVVGILGVRVVQSMLPRGQEEMDVLEERDEAAVLGPRLVRPFMDLVGVDADGDE